jgi:hypothetical protein
LERQSQNVENLNSQIKCLLKTELLSVQKRAFPKHVFLEVEYAFEINNMTYKIIRVDDPTMINKFKDDNSSLN